MFPNKSKDLKITKGCFFLNAKFGLDLGVELKGHNLLNIYLIYRVDLQNNIRF